MYKAYFAFFSTILLQTFCLSQSPRRSSVEYISINSLSIQKNTQSYFQRFGQDTLSSNNGFAVGLNTLHGARFFGYISISAGIGIDYNVNKTFLSTPYIIDGRLYSNKTRDDCLFAYLQTGQNIKWSSSFDGGGGTARYGVGVILRYNDKVSSYIDIYKKAKNIRLHETPERGLYNIIGYGISLGFVF